MSRRPHHVPRGFTLLELIVVIAIIATLVSVVAPQVFGNVGAAKVSAAKSQLDAFAIALEAYRLDNDVYPTSEQGLAALRDAPLTGPAPRNWRGPYLRKVVPADPWGQPYIYTSPGIENPSQFDIYSLGRDGKQGGTGEDADITSWGDALRAR